MSENTTPADKPETPEPERPTETAQATPAPESPAPESPAPQNPAPTPTVAAEPNPAQSSSIRPNRKSALVTALVGAAAGVVLFGGGLAVGTQIGDDSPPRSHSGGSSGVSRPGGSDQVTPRSGDQSRGWDRERRGERSRGSQGNSGDTSQNGGGTPESNTSDEGGSDGNA